MEVFILWIGLALLVGVVGKDRKLGFGMAFFWAILLSPIIGLVIALLSNKKKQEPEYISSRSENQEKNQEYKVRTTDKINYNSTEKNTKKMSMTEWKDKNPYKTINDYYREIGK